MSAQAGSRVNLLAVDKSVQLLGTGNDISKDKVQSLYKFSFQVYGPRCEKTCQRVFRPGTTQTGLYRHRIYMVAGNFGLKI